MSGYGDEKGGARGARIFGQNLAVDIIWYHGVQRCRGAGGGTDHRNINIDMAILYYHVSGTDGL